MKCKCKKYTFVFEVEYECNAQYVEAIARKLRTDFPQITDIRVKRIGTGDETHKEKRT